MSSVIGLKLVHDILDVKIDGGLRNRQLIGNLFIPIPVADQTQDFKLARCQVLLSEMFGDNAGDVGRYMPLTGSHGADDFQQSFFGVLLST